MLSAEKAAHEHVYFAHVQAHDVAAMLERADRGWPQDLGSTIDLARGMLMQALAALDDAGTCVEALYRAEG